MFVGVDGCKQGWVAIAIDDGGFLEARLFPRFDALVASFGDATVIGVDMPIGLVDGAAREADRAARAFLDGQASSVFNAPCRAALAAKSFDDALAISRRVNGTGLSRQSFALLPKVAEVDAHAAEPRIHEVHPEIAFRLLHDGRALPHRKKTWGGTSHRQALLRAAGIDLPAELGEANDVPVDDVVDAAAVAWSARRIARSEARSFPASPTQRDRSGRLIAIWA